MNKNIDDSNYFDDFDIENAPIIKHPRIKQAQENYKAQQAGFDDDVVKLFSLQNSNIKKHINDLIRRELQFLKQQTVWQG